MNNLRSLLARFTQTRVVKPADPARDWLMLITLTTLALSVSVLWNVWFFSRVVTNETATFSAPETFDVYESGAVQQLFEERATTREEYRTRYPFIDPSR